MKEFGDCSMATTVGTKPFGVTTDGRQTTLYVLRSQSVEIGLTDFGAIVTSIRTPDKCGKLDDIVTGYGDVQGYEEHAGYFGATIGRVCNRIANGRFILNGTTYSLPLNNGPNSLHGGISGFDKKLWKGQIEGEGTVVFRLTSPDGDEGYPGTVQAVVRYTLKGCELLIQYSATTDMDTIVNMTNHSYFNLAGHEHWKKIYDHKLMINAERVTPVTETLIPTGELRNVQGTIFDLRAFKALTKERLDNVPGGYDHNFCLADGPTERRLAARVEHEPSGRSMTVETTQPGVQLYTGNGVAGQPSKNGGTYEKQTCFCLETQNWPDAINHTNFPNAVLRAGETYDHKTWFTFSTLEQQTTSQQLIGSD